MTLDAKMTMSFYDRIDGTFLIIHVEDIVVLLILCIQLLIISTLFHISKKCATAVTYAKKPQVNIDLSQTKKWINKCDGIETFLTIFLLGGGGAI